MYGMTGVFPVWFEVGFSMAYFLVSLVGFRFFGSRSGMSERKNLPGADSATEGCFPDASDPVFLLVTLFLVLWFLKEVIFLLALFMPPDMSGPGPFADIAISSSFLTAYLFLIVLLLKGRTRALRGLIMFGVASIAVSFLRYFLEFLPLFGNPNPECIFRSVALMPDSGDCLPIDRIMYESFLRMDFLSDLRILLPVVLLSTFILFRIQRRNEE